MSERARSVLVGGALAVYGGVAWLACIAGGVVIGLVLDGDRDDGTSQGGSHGFAPAVPEIVAAILALLVLAYGVFFALLRRQGSPARGT